MRLIKGMVFFLLLVFFLSPPTVEGQSFGYNIVNNFFERDGSFNDKAFELVARQNPGGTVTVRLTSQELRSHPNLINLIQQAAQRYGLNLIWQPEDWAATTPEHFRQFWLPHLSEITLGEISLFTEYNYHYGQPEDYGEILVAALRANLKVPLATTNFNLTNPTGTNPFGQPMFQYQEFLGRVKEKCLSLGMSDCLNRVPVWAVSIYGRGENVDQMVGDFINQLRGFTQALAGLGVSLTGKRVIIPEAGIDPSIPIQQRLAQAAEFIKKLEERLGGDPELKGLVEKVTFLFMDDKTGKQYLIVKDENGNWVVLEYGSFGLVGFSGPVGGVSQNMGTAPGKSFIVTRTVCWERYDQVIKAIIRALQFRVSKNKPIAENLKGVNRLLIPPGKENQNKAHEAVGEVSFEVCELNTHNWFPVEEKIKVSIPSSYQQASTNVFQVAGYLNPPGKVSRSLSQKKDVSSEKRGVILASPQGEGDYLDITNFSCSAKGWQVSCQLSVNAGRTGHVWAHINGQMVGFNAIGDGLVYYYQTTLPLQTKEYRLTATVVNHDLQPKLTASASCVLILNERGDGSCSGKGVPPQPPLCQPRDNQGEPLEDEERAVEGVVRFPLRHGLVRELFEKLLATTGVCRTIDFVFTPLVSIPFTFPEEKVQRERVYQVFAPPGSEEHYLFRHASSLSQFGIIEGTEEQRETEVDIFGQKGVRNAYEYTLKLLSPPRF